MATTPREWPNQAMAVRDNIAELARSIMEQQQKIVSNEVNDEESIETIAANSIRDLNLILRALEAVGAQTDPVTELNTRVSRIKFDFSSVRA